MSVPEYPVDFYSDDVILNPDAHYQALRDLGPVVWLPHQNAFALSRYHECVEALRKPDVFISGKGLSLNNEVNKALIGSTLNSDGERHTRTRGITAPPLMPKALEELIPFINQAAQDTVEQLVELKEFDAVADFARILPMTIVTDLVGLSNKGQAKMLDWASATFDLFEGFNERSQAAKAELLDLRAFLDKFGRPEFLKENGLAYRIFDIADEKGFRVEEAAQLMRDYINPSLDTTISATGFLAYYFATQPDQWDKVLEDRTLIPNAIEEVVRLSTPIRAFSRFVACDTEIGGVSLREGQRVIVIYASANRDERQFENPNQFDVTRNVRKHIGFGHGKHMCMGLHLARREMIALVESLAMRVEKWELVGEPQIAMNNTIRAFSRLPVKVTPI